MTVRDIQTTTHLWRETRYPGTSLEHRALKVGEEAGEVQRCVTRAAEGRSGGSLADLSREVADLVIAACGVASGAGFDLSDALRDRFAEITSRT